MIPKKYSQSNKKNVHFQPLINPNKNILIINQSKQNAKQINASESQLLTSNLINKNNETRQTYSIPPNTVNSLTTSQLNNNDFKRSIQSQTDQSELSSCSVQYNHSNKSSQDKINNLKSIYRVKTNQIDRNDYYNSLNDITSPNPLIIPYDIELQNINSRQIESHYENNNFNNDSLSIESYKSNEDNNITRSVQNSNNIVGGNSFQISLKSLTNTKSTLLPQSEKKYKNALRLYCSDLNINKPYINFISLCYQISQKNKKYLSNETIKTSLSAIIWYLKNNNKKNQHTKLIKEYSLFVRHMRYICYYKTQNPNNNNHKVPAWNILLERSKYLETLVDKNAETYYLISCLYTLVPPRRVIDYACMFININDISDPRKLQNINDNKNYFYFNITNNKEQGYFIFNRYKTVSTYKSQIFRISSELTTIILEYIKLKKLKTNDSLFNIKRLEDTEQPFFYTLIKKTFGYTVNSIRHSYINYIFDNNELPSTHEIKTSSTYMAHNIQTHLDYRRRKTNKKIKNTKQYSKLSNNDNNEIKPMVLALSKKTEISAVATDINNSIDITESLSLISDSITFQNNNDSKNLLTLDSNKSKLNNKFLNYINPKTLKNLKKLKLMNTHPNFINLASSLYVFITSFILYINNK